MTPRSINQEVERLDAIVDLARRTESRAGYFPALHCGVTIAVRKGIRRGRFEDG